MGKIVKAKTIIDKISNRENVSYEGYKIEGDLDFTEAGKIELEKDFFYRSFVDAEIVFKNCEFDGKVIAYKVKEDNTYFSTEFIKKALFINCKYRSGVALNFVKFREALKFC